MAKNTEKDRVLKPVDGEVKKRHGRKLEGKELERYLNTWQDMEDCFRLLYENKY